MHQSLEHLVKRITPESTILFFGAGAAVPSNAPSANKLAEHLAIRFNITQNNYTLSEIASLVEEKVGRRELISEIRNLFAQLKPAGGLLNIPLYKWKSIFTTNYETLIEQCYKNKKEELVVYSSNFDFTVHDKVNATKLFKIHGTIDKDISDGHQSRIIITEGDYDNTEDYREHIFDRLKSDIAGSTLIIIGYSLADPDIKALIDRAIKIKATSGGTCNIHLVLFTKDEQRAELYEKRGLNVYFGGVDEFFEAVARHLAMEKIIINITDNPLDAHPLLRPTTIDVEHASNKDADASAMFNGWPASYADIEYGLTFERSILKDIDKALIADQFTCVTLLGASGVGKTTATRQVLQHLRKAGYLCWEHKQDHLLPNKEWIDIARSLERKQQRAILFIDEAHNHLYEINDLLDSISNEKLTFLKLLLVSSRNLWNHRVKTPALFKIGKELNLEKLDAGEISNLLQLIDTKSELKILIEDSFSGFSSYERKRRLQDRCERDMFVCLKNIFASEKFDDIILREYAALEDNYRDIYRLVAAMQSIGIRVHRQLVMRVLGIPSATIPSVLSHLTDIIHEYEIDPKEGIYGWKGRHLIIVDIVTKYKFSDAAQILDLFNKVIDCISPTYDIEIRTIRELCNVDSGLKRISSKKTQNTLLRKMMSVAPGERIPRHRLIRNLIEMGEFEKVETEIRIFEKDFGQDGPLARYKIMLLTARAAKSKGILNEDRIVILQKAQNLATQSISKYPNNKYLLAAYCEVGIQHHQITGEYTIYDLAIKEMKDAEDRIGDPEISKMVSRFEQMLNSRSFEEDVSKNSLVNLNTSEE